MITSGIVIHWDAAEEYIELDFENPESLYQISHSLEQWNKTDDSVIYNIESSVKKISNNIFEITNCYKQEANPQIRLEGCLWGVSNIVIDLSKNSGHATGSDYDDSTHNGQCAWERIDRPFLKELKRKRISSIQREQAKFRSALLIHDGVCVITGESTSSALEAAHIIPSSEGGPETIDNGILLRADIHKMYDSGCFSIKPDGEITNIDIGKISESYKNLLQSCKIDSKTVSRVKERLLHQWNKGLKSS